MPIYFLDLGPIKIECGNVTISKKIDLKFVHQEIDNIKDGIETATRMYNERNDTVKIKGELVEEANSLEADINRLYDLVGLERRKRFKRGWFDGVGTVFKHVFGTMDAQDEKSIQEAIRVIKDNELIVKS